MKIKNKFKFVRSIIILVLLVVLLVLKIQENFFKNNNESVPASAEAEVIDEGKKDTTINMSVIGDIMCHNSQYEDAYDSKTDTYDFSYVFEDVKEHISSADIAIGNLETTFAGKERGYSNYPTFNTPEALAMDLKEIGIDVLSTANNHSLDKGYTGLVSTLNFLDEAGISHMGTYDSYEAKNEVLVKEVNGIKIAFLSFTYGTNGIPVPSGKEYCINLIDKDLILKQIEYAKSKNVDIISVNMHWGVEYRTTPNDEQKELADFLFENGVDLILGSHPHVIETMEKRTITLADGSTKDGFVIYSLGNFISGQVKENTKNTIILDLQITKHAEGNITIDSAKYTPLYMYKSSKGSTKKYKLLDIEKTISNYENGADMSIGSSTYNTLNTELQKIYKTIGSEF